jgi:hypothetical protein
VGAKCGEACPLSKAFTALTAEEHEQAKECPRCKGHLPSEQAKESGGKDEKNRGSQVAEDEASANSQGRGD